MTPGRRGSSYALPVILLLGWLAATAGAVWAAGNSSTGPSRIGLAESDSGVMLVMFDAASCIYCRRWDAEVGQNYARTAEGRFAPLVRRRIGDSDTAFIRSVRYTPTFVLLDGTRELGRIVGYGGQEFFWQQLEGLLAKAGFGMMPPAAGVRTL